MSGKVLGIYLIARIFYNVLGAGPAVMNVLCLLGVISMSAGVILALYQWDFKRLLAYHSISQIGYIILGLGLGTPLGILGALFHLLNHSAFKPLLFLGAGSVENAAGTRKLKELGGLSQKMPVTSATSMIASLSISGVPPLNGFWSKLIIVIACVQAGKYWFAAFAVGASILTLASFLKVQRYVFSGFLKDKFLNVKEAGARMLIPMVVLSACCILLGLLLLPGIFDRYLGLAVNALLRGTGYAQAVITELTK
jgi:multicomponent Na+:H+ antiporter subunit D